MNEYSSLEQQLRLPLNIPLQIHISKDPMATLERKYRSSATNHEMMSIRNAFTIPFRSFDSPEVDALVTGIGTFRRAIVFKEESPYHSVQSSKESPYGTAIRL
jgi:hypothetical protein